MQCSWFGMAVLRGLPLKSGHHCAKKSRLTLTQAVSVLDSIAVLDVMVGTFLPDLD